MFPLNVRRPCAGLVPGLARDGGDIILTLRLPFERDYRSVGVDGFMVPLQCYSVRVEPSVLCGELSATLHVMTKR